MSLPSPLRGIIPPLITPLNSDSSLDVKSLERMLSHIMEGGVHGVFILGTTGESSGLSYAVKNQLIEQTCKFVAGRIPVLVGITDCSFQESLNLANLAKSSGAEAVVAAPPFYMNIGQEELSIYFKRLADEIPLPLFLYNMPSHTKIAIEHDTVVQLAKHSNIIGLKDSSGNGVYFQSLLNSLASEVDFTLTVGPEEMMAETVLMGGHGAVAGGANLFPSLYVKLYEAAVNRDFQKIQTLQKVVMEVSSGLYGFGNCKSSYLRGVKATCAFLGLSQGYLASPLYGFSDSEMVVFRKKFDQVHALVLSVT
ncbi:MAG: dihydrodipicolinate synthase family protein [Algoriphagus sp.]|nr:dihydrodipicolinate synthase family protein [Algoriphagus sp.]